MFKKLLCAALITLTVANAQANNVMVSNVSISGQNTTTHFSLINLDVNWDNSWRTSTNESNYDGCWMFFKFRKANSSLWQHATINYGTNGNAGSSGHTQPSGSTLKTAADGKGVWIYRNGDGTGNVNFPGAALRWNYGVDGVLDNDSVEIRAYAVEMVYVPQGTYALGTGGAETGYFRAGGQTNPFMVSTESAITIGNATGNLFYTTGGTNGDGLGPVPAAFPKGYNAFWVMKYEASEQQYVDFLNALDANQATARNLGFPGAANNYTANFPERASGGYGSEDALAFMDWAAMRPFTELEYEKACRGANIVPIPNEYAWGNTTISSTSTVYNTGTPQETPVQGNCNYGFALNRTLRVGAYANDTTDTRTETGATYYGAMEMSGNAWEFAVTVGNTSGRAFTGLHGDGNLDNLGTSNVAAWTTTMIGFRGGAFQSPVATLRVSERASSTSASTTRNGQYGLRAARTAE